MDANLKQAASPAAFPTDVSEASPKTSSPLFSADTPVGGKNGIGTVALFATCINDVMYPEACIATVRLLERLGCEVALPLEQTCCGQIFTNTGYHAEALGAVRAYVEAFSCFDYVVGPSGSCVASVRDQHPLLAAETQDEDFTRTVVATVAKTYELSEFLIDVLGIEDVGAYFPHTVTFHPTCHAVRMAKIGDRPQRLLAQVQGLRLVPLVDADQCCGFGGTFSVKNDLMSAAMVSDKAREVMGAGAEYLVNVDNACLMNIGGRLHREGSPVKTIHRAEILASPNDQVGKGA
jgi:L-lactate dehydrogenase complex protein LldE